jgi:hypothetical protein
MTDDLFTHAEGIALRDFGMEAAASAEDQTQPLFSDTAYQTICAIAERQETVHVNDVLLACPVKPLHPNAWGAVWMRAIRAKVIEKAGYTKPCTVDPGKHNHDYPVYRSLIIGRDIDQHPRF